MYTLSYYINMVIHCWFAKSAVYWCRYEEFTITACHFFLYNYCGICLLAIRRR